MDRDDVCNRTGDYCYRDNLVCDHNQIDGPARMFVCIGIGGQCINGNKYYYYIKGDETYRFKR